MSRPQPYFSLTESHQKTIDSVNEKRGAVQPLRKASHGTSALRRDSAFKPPARVASATGSSGVSECRAFPASKTPELTEAKTRVENPESRPNPETAIPLRDRAGHSPRMGTDSFLLSALDPIVLRSGRVGLWVPAASGLVLSPHPERWWRGVCLPVERGGGRDRPRCGNTVAAGQGTGRASKTGARASA